MIRKSLMLATLLTASITVQGQEVSVCWLDDAATVTVSDDILPLVKVNVSGADVYVEQDASVEEEIIYRLSGHSAGGSFTHVGSFKITLSLEGLQLTSQTSAAINIKNGKRIAVVLKDATENTLTDKEGGDQKACMIVKGHAEFQGGGMLTINGRGRHGIKAKEYVEMKSAVLSITTTAGGYWDAEDKETKAAACIKTDEDVIIKDGTISLLSTGDGGKGINCDNTFTMNGGTLTVRTTGARYIYEHYDHTATDVNAIPDSLKNSPKAIKADQSVCINGGTLNIYTEQNGGEGLESKGTLTITGGDIHIKAFDDCINAAGDILVSGGDLYISSLDNDGIDTNQSMYISGGNITTLGNYLHEQGIDVNDKSPKKKLYLMGGNVVCVGGTSQVSHPYICDEAQPALYYKGKVAAGTSLLLRCMTTHCDIMRYHLDRDYTAEAGGVQPELCMMFSSPLLQVGCGYELVDETTAEVLGRVRQLDELYSNLRTSGDSSGIETLTSEHLIHTPVFYNLVGRRVSLPSHGIYILNWRKVVK